MLGSSSCSIVFLLAGYFVVEIFSLFPEDVVSCIQVQKGQILMIPLYTIELQKLRDSYPPSERNSFENLFLVALEQLVYFLEEICNMLWGVGPAYWGQINTLLEYQSHRSHKYHTKSD
ncbi:Protein Ycf2 [Linum perenne]